MKAKKLVTSFGCGAAALLAAVSVASAAPVTYNTGDVLMGFRVNGNPNDVVVNVGPSTQFAGLSAGTTFSLSLGNAGNSVAADLSANYGSGWFTSSQVLWSLSSNATAGDVPNTLYATRAAGSQPWTRFSNSGQSQATNRFTTLANAYENLQTGGARESTSNSSKAAVINNTVDATTSYTFFTQPNDDFSYFPGGIESTVGAGGALDLFRMERSTTFGLPGELLGTFAINSAGLVTFTAVPEPSVVALSVLGAIALLFVALRRRSAAAKAA